MTIELTELRKIAGLEPPVTDGDGRAVELKACCRNCGERLDFGELQPLSRILCPYCGAALIVPQYFGGYFIVGFCDGALDNYVCQAYDPVLRRDVALKISKASAETLGGVRLLDNVRTLTLVDQPGVMPVLDGGTWNDYAFWVMPWMERGTLADVLKLPFDERFTLRQTVRLLQRLARVLATARQRGYGHYDVNPRNVLINYEWMGYLTNFRRNDEYVDYSDLPQGLTRFDGWRYFSPSVLGGETPCNEDDAFSFGVMIFEILAGNYPFGAVNDVDQLRQVQQQSVAFAAVRRHEAATPEIQDLVERMMDLAPGRRPGWDEIVRVFENRLEEVL